ncbi:MAG: hypothetical protein WBQ38_08175 [Ignavibacteria bacterium]|mgnify:CR=1 FL=1|nr:hypothetical protein [Ignavibacteria bacterium]MBK6772680.1 hypothetical protein [Ignavibacteria bacterium]MBK7254500.1 hypothetical protein [Ignavibacteria bacterium]MBK8380642.1 hypothetical protein [Ignavibacteria bacterium]MBK9405992.1 hypothetical protein [Ignavibacteria bacterium]
MNTYEKVFSDSGNKKVVLINDNSDPSMWILYVYKKILFFKKKINTYWFSNKDQAELFALEYVKNNS